MGHVKQTFAIISVVSLALGCADGARADKTAEAASLGMTVEPVSEQSTASSPDASSSEVDISGSPQRGREKFVTLGCVQCHSVNGVGGKVGPSFDGFSDEGAIDPIDFASWMWEDADLMVPLQEMELGYRITLNGEDIRDLAAFASSVDEQEDFSIEEIPPTIRERIMGEIDMSDTSDERFDGQEWHGKSPFGQKDNEPD
ncbi:MAG: c-type cytochrome [Parvularcula sp.]